MPAWLDAAAVTSTVAFRSFEIRRGDHDGSIFIITSDARAFARLFVKTYTAREYLELFDGDGGRP